MRNKIIFSLALVMTAGCSSTSSKREKSNSYSPRSEVMEAPKVDRREAPAPVMSEKDKVKPVAPAASLYDSLNEGIKNQNDEKIFNSATMILTQNPNDLKALNAMGLYHYKKGRFDLAKYLFSKAIGANPNSAESYSNLGVVYLAQNERREAIKSFRKALSLNSSDAVASANLGAIYVQEKDYNKAIFALEIAYNKGLRDSKNLNNYGVALAATKKYDRAEEIYKIALKDQNTNKEVLVNYAILLVENLGKNQEGLDLISRLKFVGVPSEARNRINALENKAKAGVK